MRVNLSGRAIVLSPGAINMSVKPSFSEISVFEEHTLAKQIEIARKPISLPAENERGWRLSGTSFALQAKIPGGNITRQP
jgi:hypothetical protein